MIVELLFETILSLLEGKLKATFSAGAIVGEKIFFSDNFVNALVLGDIQTGQCKCIGHFTGEKNSTRHLHRNAVLFEEYIVFAPNRGEHVHIYNTNTGEIREIKVFRSSDSEYVFSNSILDGNYLWIFPGNTEQPILKVNLLNGDEDCLDNLAAIMGNEKTSKSCAALNCMKSENKIYAPIYGTSTMVVLDVTTEKVSIIDIPIENMFFVFLLNNKKWISTRDSIFEWNEQTNECVKYAIEGGVVAPILFPGISNGVLLTSEIGGDIYELRNDNFLLNQQLFLERTSTYSIGFTYEAYAGINGGTVIFPPYGRKCVVYKNGYFRELPLTIDITALDQKIMNGISHRISEEIMYEGKYIDLNDFLHVI